MKLPLRLLTTILALTLFANALAGDEPATSSVAGSSFLTGSTITCSTAWPSATFACWWEKRILTLGPVEFSVALDTQLVLNDASKESYVSPMLSVAWYGETTSFWLEAALPADWLPVPHVGRGDWLRLGVSWTLP